MIRPFSADQAPTFDLWTHTLPSLVARLPDVVRFLDTGGPAPLSQHPNWLRVMRDGLGYRVYGIEARANGLTCGFLPLAEVDSFLFGRFLVSLPYLNSNGVVAAAADVQAMLIDRAVELAGELNARHLELRHERPIEHTALTHTLDSKVHLRLPLPRTRDEFWKRLDAKVRNQVRKGEKSDLRVEWGGADLLAPFYAVFSANMRDLGTPVYGRDLFASILDTFPADAELCVTWAGDIPVATALLLHGPGVTEVPTASSLRKFNPTCANMLLYRHLIERAIDRGQAVFDFGRSTADGPTFKFKRQWGATPHPTAWQYHVRSGKVGEMRPDHPRYQRMIRVWQKLPLPLTRLIGPPLVRGIP